MSLHSNVFPMNVCDHTRTLCHWALWCTQGIISRDRVCRNLDRHQRGAHVWPRQSQAFFVRPVLQFQAIHPDLRRMGRMVQDQTGVLRPQRTNKSYGRWVLRLLYSLPEEASPRLQNCLRYRRVNGNRHDGLQAVRQQERRFSSLAIVHYSSARPNCRNMLP